MRQILHFLVSGGEKSSFFQPLEETNPFPALEGDKFSIFQTIREGVEKSFPLK
jgi:hypothetical protein